MHRVQGEDHARQNGAWHLKPAQEHDEETCGQPVKRGIHQVIAKRLVSEDAMQGPECGVQHGVVLLGGAHLKPDAP